MIELWQAIVHLILVLLNLLVQFAVHGSLLLAWVAWWLAGVNWKKAWHVLAVGGWAPLVLLSLLSAGAWSQIAPGEYSGLGFVTVPNYWWQLGGVGILVASALFCGWLQGVLGIQPIEVNFDPPAHADHHGHAAHSHH